MYWQGRFMLMCCCALLIFGFGNSGNTDNSQIPSELDRIADSYVQLVLALGSHVEGYVWLNLSEVDVPRSPPSLEEIVLEADRLSRDISAFLASANGATDLLRGRALQKHLHAVRTRATSVDSEPRSFDTQLFDYYSAPPWDTGASVREDLLTDLSDLLPGQGTLSERYELFLQDFIVPKSRVPEVFEAAIAACRAQTLKFIELPLSERVEIGYTEGEAYNAMADYFGDFRTSITLNTTLPLVVDQVIDLACHEAYPGHHVFEVLREQELVRERSWIEYAILHDAVPVLGLSEGTAEYGVELTFDGPQRTALLSKIMTMSGMDPNRLSEFENIQEIVRRAIGIEGSMMPQVSFQSLRIARKYFDGEIDRAQAVDEFMNAALMPRGSAEQWADFVNVYGVLVALYYGGEGAVRRYIESRSATSEGSISQRWALFRELLVSPLALSDLE